MRNVSLEFGSPFSDEDIDQFLNSASYTEVSCNSRDFEHAHNSVHLFVGGDLDTFATSVDDPLFFAHHAFVDLIWEEFRLRKQSRDQREAEFFRS